MTQLSDVQSSLNTLTAALARWQDRDDTVPQPEIRKAAGTAIGAIDEMLRELYLMRGRLVSEIRASDQAADARADAMLAAAHATEDSHG